MTSSNHASTMIPLNNREVKSINVYKINAALTSGEIYHISVVNDESTMPNPNVTPVQGPSPRTSQFSMTQAQRNHSFGNKILLCLPAGTLIIPAFFTLLAFFIGNILHTIEIPRMSHVPFISDLGSGSPQRCIFTFGLALSAFFSLAIILVRYYQVKLLFVKNDSRTNVFGLVAGIIFVIGKLITASFQISSVKFIHYGGAGMYVCFAAIYATIQSFISYKNSQFYNGKIFIIIRIVLTIGMCVGSTLFVVFIIPDLHKYNRGSLAVAQNCEWVFAFCKVFFMMTFVVDFWKLDPVFYLRSFDDQIQPPTKSCMDYIVQNYDVTEEVHQSSNNSNKNVIPNIEIVIGDRTG